MLYKVPWYTGPFSNNKHSLCPLQTFLISMSDRTGHPDLVQTIKGMSGQAIVPCVLAGSAPTVLTMQCGLSSTLHNRLSLSYPQAIKTSFCQQTLPIHRQGRKDEAEPLLTCLQALKISHGDCRWWAASGTSFSCQTQWFLSKDQETEMPHLLSVQ